MKVLFQINIVSPYRINFFNELGKFCDLTVIFERKTASNRDKNWISDKPKNFKAVFLPGIKYRQEQAFCPGITKYLDKDLFDIFVVAGYSTPTGILAIQILKHKKIPFFISIEGGFIHDDPKMKFLLKKSLISSANWYFCSSQSSDNYLVHYGAKRSKIFRFSFTPINKIDKAHRSDVGTKRQIKKDLLLSGKKIILGVGRFVKFKNYAWLLSQWKDINSQGAELLLIGGGPEKKNYQNIIAKYSLDNVSLIDFTGKSELEKYYKVADIFIHPAREEVWGLVVVEALHHGLPVIGSSICNSALALVKDNYNGYIIDSEKGERKVKKFLELLLGNEQLRNTMSRNARKSVKDFTIEQMALEHLDAFQKVLKFKAKQ